MTYTGLFLRLISLHFTLLPALWDATFSIHGAKETSNTLKQLGMCA
jgi:hypothetical protein